ncbi:hypothetical protein MKK88_33600 [Methylobacterium sp. E-005]|uniref:hypothetical protein n=1 Tax=Methylobacterium sp. E-005 TaxID=2836549 RepID=UPI001FBBE1AF|nr:hypothetical protein [Methylobacterium sp. E-005]MCJ2090882.1 hypothetical protein [Methylobacterium sp. E-005]
MKTARLEQTLTPPPLRNRLDLPNGWSLRWGDPKTHMTCSLHDPAGEHIGNLMLADAERFAAAMKPAS